MLKKLCILVMTLLWFSTAFAQSEDEEDLMLTPEQRVAIRQIMIMHGDSLRSVMVKIIDVRKAIKAELLAEPPDYQALNDLQTEIGRLKKSLSSKFGARSRDIREVLTDEQKKIWDKRNRTDEQRDD